MGTIVTFTGGKHCKDCGEQIEPARLRYSPDAARCITCQRDREQQIAIVRRGSRPQDIEIIRG